MPRLCNATLGAMTGVAVPGYDRTGLSPGIVHFGIGNFHRAHQGVYLDDLFATGSDHDWAIVGAGVMPSDENVRRIMRAQDYLTTVVEQEADWSAARITGPMVDFVAPDDRRTLLDRLADPAIRIVSMTITEGGYFIDPATGEFDPDAAAIVADGRNRDDPKTVFGLIVAALARRRAQGTPALTVMSCDNVPHNGAVARDAVVGLADLSDPALGRWIGDNVAFPNGMVDRITPATGERERELTRREFGIEDDWPVCCEHFRQWVLEDTFSAGRPALESVGVELVADVTPYEHMKIRILNGGHAIIAYPGGLLGLHFAHEAMQHPQIRGFLEKVQREEIIPTVPPVPNTSLRDYQRLTAKRFANPKMGDTVRRLCLDGSNRQPKFIIPTITDNLAAGRAVDGLALESALWCRYCYGVTDGGAQIDPGDPDWERLQGRAREAKDAPEAWLEMADIYGHAGRSQRFRSAFSAWLQQLWADGTETVLQRYLDGARSQTA